MAVIEKICFRHGCGYPGFAFTVFQSGNLPGWAVDLDRANLGHLMDLILDKSLVIDSNGQENDIRDGQ